jgi:polyisoprenyl-phosphate glycosyltransferase
VGTGIQTSIKEMVEIAKSYFHISEEPRWGTMEKRNWDTNTWLADCTKINATLGWSPVVTLPEGFARTAVWFQENRLRLPSNH